jgi:hypothetical protein
MIAIGTTSCQKDDDNVGTSPVGSSVERFDQIQASPDFKWSTETNYTLNITGLKNLPFERTGIIDVADEAGTVVFRQLIKMTEDQQLQFNAAANIDEFTISFGQISKTIIPSGNSLAFDFIPVDDRSDLDPADR